MGMDAWVEVKFYDNKNKKIRTKVLDCYKGGATCEEIKIPRNAQSVIVCFTTSDEECENCTD